MDNFVKNLADLVKVKTICTLVIMAVFAVLALRGDITPDQVVMTATTVLAFYFGTQHEKGNRKADTLAKPPDGE